MGIRGISAAVIDVKILSLPLFVQLHDMAVQADRCQERAERTRGASLVPPHISVGAIRISGSGWEGWILEGLQVLRPSTDTHKPYPLSQQDLS